MPTANDRNSAASVSYPVDRPASQALLVCSAPTRGQARVFLEQQGFRCVDADDPYAAVASVCRQPGAFGALILSLASVYREELPLIAMIKRRFPAIEVWLIHTDGRQAALAQAMRLGADGLVSDDGLHRIALAAEPAPPPAPPTVTDDASDSQASDASLPGEPILTADELRALLHDHPSSTGKPP